MVSVLRILTIFSSVDQHHWARIMVLMRLKSVSAVAALLRRPCHFVTDREREVDAVVVTCSFIPSRRVAFLIVGGQFRCAEKSI